MSFTHLHLHTEYRVLKVNVVYQVIVKIRLLHLQRKTQTKIRVLFTALTPKR